MFTLLLLDIALPYGKFSVQTAPHCRIKTPFFIYDYIVHRNVDDKQNIFDLLLVGIATSTSKNLYKLLSIAVQHLLFEETNENAHFQSDTFW